ncbi:MAG: hypothetical protein GYB38_01480 [Gammaproteobacteria bacterium]|nr:hypothetical protein [Gammaproteobacteria bacterium]
MSDDKPRLIMKWINNATHEQISHATSYIQRQGLELPHASTCQQSLINLFTNEPAQGNPYPLERWVTFQKMTAHCRQKKHKLHSGKVQLSASIRREHKEKLEHIAKEMNTSQSEVLELLIENYEKIKSKQKQGRKEAKKSHHSSVDDIPTMPKTFIKSAFQEILEDKYSVIHPPISGDYKGLI